jgi:acyl carrier protein
MDKQAILSQTQDIFRDYLEDDGIVLTNTTTANDVEGWDSLSHLQLIVAMENHFKIKFSSKEILAWKNVGELIESIAARIGKENA